MINWKDKTYYEILRIDEKATPEEIKAAYHDIARVYHPDSNFFDEILGQVGPTAQQPAVKQPVVQQTKPDEFFHLLTEAYATLRNTKKREIYDRKLNEKRGTAEPEMRPPPAPPAAPKPISAAPPPAGRPLAEAVQKQSDSCDVARGRSGKAEVFAGATPAVAVHGGRASRMIFYVLPALLLVLTVFFLVE
ncbi:MAG: J domain-containing protein [bacterium]|nr:J domain-containing protein [bacterium]